MTGPEALTAVATLGGLSGIGAIITAVISWRRDRHRPRVDRATAQEAEVRAITSARTADLDEVRKILDEVKEHRDEIKTERDELRRDLVAALGELAAARDDLRAARGELDAALRQGAELRDRVEAAEARAREAEAQWRREADYVAVLLDHWPTPPPPPRPA